MPSCAWRSPWSSRFSRAAFHLRRQGAELIGEVCRYRPAQTPEWIGIATDALSRSRFPPLERPSGWHCHGRRRQSRARRSRGAAGGSARHLPLRRLHSRRRRRRANLCGKRPARRDRRRETADAPVPRIREIVQQALQEAIAQQSNGLVIETMAAAMKGGRGVPGFNVGDFARLASPNIPAPNSRRGSSAPARSRVLARRPPPRSRIKPLSIFRSPSPLTRRLSATLSPQPRPLLRRPPLMWRVSLLSQRRLHPGDDDRRDRGDPAAAAEILRAA